MRDFYDYGAIKEVLERNCGAQNFREKCRDGGCRQCAIRNGERRNPLLPGAELGATLASIHMLRECQVPTDLLSQRLAVASRLRGASKASTGALPLQATDALGPRGGLRAPPEARCHAMRVGNTANKGLGGRCERGAVQDLLRHQQ